MNRFKKVFIFIGSITASLAAGGIGSLATTPNIPTWYTALAKPPFVPPNEVFGPVWSLLYVLMGIALALVIIAKPTKADSPKKRWAYIWFGIQLALNTLWSLLFFGLRAPWSGVIVILLLLAAIILNLREFKRYSCAAWWLLLPYLAWVSFATYLTIGIAVLN